MLKKLKGPRKVVFDDTVDVGPIARAIPATRVTAVLNALRRPDTPVAIGAFTLYGVAYVLLEPAIGIFATTLAAGPAIVAAWYWGARGAIATAAAMCVLHVGLALTSGDPPEQMRLVGALQAAMIALVAGGGVGALRDRERAQRRLIASLANRINGMERELQEEPEVYLPDEPEDTLDRTFSSTAAASFAPPGAEHEDVELDELLWRYAFHDQLTDLPNRALMVERLDELLGHHRGSERGQIALLLLDLDRFKVINDTFGHLKGDQLLADLARRLRAATGEDILVARLGSDEFAVLLSDVSNDRDVVRMAERILKLLQVPFSMGRQQANARGSMGLARATSSHQHPRDLVRDAELAMSHAKSDGGGGFAFFDEAMREELQLRTALEHDLRKALVHQQLHLNYQPIVNLANGEISGFEALVRWRHPTRGLVGPGTFIPVAEETGLIVPLGRWVLETTCDHLQSWHWGPGRHKPIQINVNVSPKQLDEGGLPAQIAAALSSRALPPSRLAVEITESAMASDAVGAGEQLQLLRDAHIKLCVDDFGTGYSSLAQLLRCPADTLKIDRSFVERMAWREEDAAVVRTIIRLGHDLNMNVVAEGIETNAQLQMIRSMGCEKGQGYLFSRPMSPAAVGELLSRPSPWQAAFSA